MKNEQKTKKKNSFLPTIIIVGVLAVATVVSFLVSGDVTILRDSVVATLGIGACSACAQGGALIVKNIKNGSQEKQSRQRNRNRNRNQEMARLNTEENVQNLNDDEIYNATSSKTNKQNKSR